MAAAGNHHVMVHCSMGSTTLTLSFSAVYAEDTCIDGHGDCDIGKWHEDLMAGWR